ncbi:MAG: hypothetical protein ACLP1W_09290 [Rhodomicrobium sp.]
MNEIEEIRRLLDCVEEHLSQAKDDEERKLRDLDALEFPDLVAAIVDFLQPLLGPYEAAIYWRMFRQCYTCHTYPLGLDCSDSNGGAI